MEAFGLFWGANYETVIDLLLGFTAIGILAYEAKEGRTVGDMNPLRLGTVLILLLGAYA